MKNFITLCFSTLVCLSAFSQGGIYISGGLGTAYSSGNLDGISASYESYKTLMKQNLPSDPFDDNGNWKTGLIRPVLLINAGLRSESILLNFAYQRASFNQEKSLIRQSGYGRKFAWDEVRHEVLTEVGGGIDQFYAFAGFGVNFCSFTMASYQVYPDGTESINSEFTFNGLFKGEDVGLSLSLGAKYYLKDYLNIEFKYILSTDKLIGGPDEFLTINDLSFARNPATSEYPGDYTQPLSLDNNVLVGVRRNYFQLSINFELNHD